MSARIIFLVLAAMAQATFGGQQAACLPDGDGHGKGCLVCCRDGGKGPCCCRESGGGPCGIGKNRTAILPSVSSVFPPDLVHPALIMFAGGSSVGFRYSIISVRRRVLLPEGSYASRAPPQATLQA